MGKYHRPCNLKDALSVLAGGDVTLAAGCTDLFPTTQAQELPGSVLDLTAVEGLRGITRTEAGWRLGATTTWTDVLRAELPGGFDMLKAAAREVGSVQIQNAGTLAGNLCNASPAADGVPPLLALDAQVEVASVDGSRVLPLSDFLAGVRQTALHPGEMVVAVHVPEAAGRGQSVFHKLGARRYLVISIAMVAARIVAEQGVIKDAAIAVGACSPVAQRLSRVENSLRGLPLRDAASALRRVDIDPGLSPISDVRGSSDYREDVAFELVRRALLDLGGADV
ncbi:FAD binding domain-containing protein [Shimia aestuarii]|uniref:CO or xanthine dehydrogenase, FAD-binding subunit n=1 Tax=Shimia aestuarii TaxID=254406 RepID=A0A1I4T0M3_9RHOB|nr:xanthine dehydrogenase family protein subunit M [Shimia aestuarii]SFM70284.1 CO or xanthine dehydrogenase, FAD-binding subunit [Shimia aestuarii]